VLLDIDVGRTSTTNAHMNMIGGKELGSQLLKALWESSREQQIAMITVGVGVCKMLVVAGLSDKKRQRQHTSTAHDLCHLLFPVVMKHLIGLVNDGVSGIFLSWRYASR